MNSSLAKKVAYGLLTAALFIHGYLFWKDKALIAKGYPDFTIFYSAGLMVRQGLGHQLYDDAVQFRVQRSFAPGVEIRQGPLPYNHPPFEALVYVPFTYLHYLWAYLAWDLLNLAMLVLALHRLRPHIGILKEKSWAFWLLCLLGFFPVAFGLLQGQDVTFLFLLESLAFSAFKRNSNFAAGCWLGFGSFKFHLLLAAIFVIAVGWKRLQVLYGFLATCGALGILSVVMIGWREALWYPRYVLFQERVMGHGAILPSCMPSLRGLFEGWILPVDVLRVAHVLMLICSVALVFWALAICRKYAATQIDLCFALAICVSVLVSYHALIYDLALLVIPLLIAVTKLAAKNFSWRRSYLFTVPIALLLFSPLYAFLSFQTLHVNLIAVVLFCWVLGMWQQMKSGVGLNVDGMTAAS